MLHSDPINFIINESDIEIGQSSFYFIVSYVAQSAKSWRQPHDRATGFTSQFQYKLLFLKSV